jgi:S1-C subfamily serine protease
VADGVYPAIGLSRRDPQIGDPVHILGFPGVVLSHELLNQSSTLDASATNGTVSGIKFDAIGQELVQTDASASHGNSGGPGVNNDAELVGVMVAVTLSPSGGSIVQGFNFLIPAKDVAKFLDGTEVTKPGDSKFNPVWGGRHRALPRRPLQGGRRQARRREQAGAEPGRRQAHPRRGQPDGEESAAPALPVGVGRPSA